MVLVHAGLLVAQLPHVDVSEIDGPRFFSEPVHDRVRGDAPVHGGRARSYFVR